MNRLAAASSGPLRSDRRQSECDSAHVACSGPSVGIGAAPAQCEQRRSRQQLPPHGRSPNTATPWRCTIAQPFQPVTSSTNTVSAERIRPIGTTEV